MFLICDEIMRLFGIVDKKEEKVNSVDYDLKHRFSVWQIYWYDKQFFFDGSISSNCWNLWLKWQFSKIIWNAVDIWHHNNSTNKVNLLQIVWNIFHFSYLDPF